jgi:hypothetical protein
MFKSQHVADPVGLREWDGVKHALRLTAMFIG